MKKVFKPRPKVDRLQHNRVFKQTKENWHPSYKLDGWYHGSQETYLVEVSLLKLGAYDSKPPQWRVCVWGGDDFGMERDYNYEDKAQAVRMFMAILAEDYVTQAFLKENKFVNA
jgi:hypothetical protein